MTPEAKFVKGALGLQIYELRLTPHRSRPARNGAPRYTSVPLEARADAAAAREYEREYKRDHGDLQGFYDSSFPFLRHPEVRRWGDALGKERESDFESRGASGH